MCQVQKINFAPGWRGPEKGRGKVVARSWQGRGKVVARSWQGHPGCPGGAAVVRSKVVARALMFSLV